MTCPKCGVADCRVSIVKRALPVNVKVTTTTWCRRCWWQEEKSENVEPEKAALIEASPSA